MKNLWRFAIICILLTFGLAHPPYDTWDVYHSIQSNSCKSAESADSSSPLADLEDLCQRCAKFTMSSNVYPMCCTNQDEVRTWCRKAIEYGHQ